MCKSALIVIGAGDGAVLEQGTPLRHLGAADHLSGIMQDLTAEERAQELEQAKRQVLAYCPAEKEE